MIIGNLTFNQLSQDCEAPIPYGFAYFVKDETSSSDFSHKETSDGKTVSGSYSVVLPYSRTSVNYYGYVDDDKYPEYEAADRPTYPKSSYPTQDVFDSSESVSPKDIEISKPRVTPFRPGYTKSSYPVYSRPAPYKESISPKNIAYETTGPKVIPLKSVKSNPKLDSSKTSPKYPVHPKPAKAEPIPPKKLKSKVTPSETIHPKEETPKPHPKNRYPKPVYSKRPYPDAIYPKPAYRNGAYPNSGYSKRPYPNGPYPKPVHHNSGYRKLPYPKVSHKDPVEPKDNPDSSS